MGKKDDARIFNVRISEASKIIWEGKAVSVSSENAEGKFDILAMHSNFITLVRKAPITVVDAEGNETVYKFDLSVIFVTGNIVKVFADIQ